MGQQPTTTIIAESKHATVEGVVLGGGGGGGCEYWKNAYRERLKDSTTSVSLPSSSKKKSRLATAVVATDSDSSVFTVRTELTGSCSSSRSSSVELEDTFALSSSSSSHHHGHPRAVVVRFSTVRIFSHAVILGDNPSVSAGPPLALGPECVSEECWELDAYEETRCGGDEDINNNNIVPQQQQQQPRRRRRRSGRELAVNRWAREDWLKHQGYARRQLTEVVQQVQAIQACRRKHARLTTSEWIQRWSRQPRKVLSEKAVH